MFHSSSESFKRSSSMELSSFFNVASSDTACNLGTLKLARSI
uniref:Uncharacterized protein n=1 Tax=Podoviridae sp. ctrTt13 TaxID=2825279 RepID=A0A8S5NU86_9CAUD|nr:MAG TPA: hypothetical protein [Podoviridae sp. ctrTt13]